MTHRSDDRELLAQAERERRILLTEDKDFGWLVYVSQEDSPGVILMRFPGNVRESLTRAVEELVRDQGKDLENSFVVVQPGHTRISRGP